MANIERRTRLRAGDTDRDAVLEVLHSAFAAGRLTPSDLADRQEAALSARYIDELPELVEDVPEGASLVGGWGSSMPAQHPWSVTPASGQQGQWTATILTGRRIDLGPGATVRNFALLGGDDVYLRDALGPGVVLTLELPTVLGGHTLHVPEGVRVVEETQAIMGGNTIRRSAQGDGSHGTLVIRGMLVLGGHTVKRDKRPR